MGHHTINFKQNKKTTKNLFLTESIISTIYSVIFIFFLLCGSIIKNIITNYFTNLISFAIIFILGLFKLFDSLDEYIINNRKFIYNDDIVYSYKPIKYCKIMLSEKIILIPLDFLIDVIMVGIAMGMLKINIILTILFYIICNFIFIILKLHIGNKKLFAMFLNVAWIKGILLIILAFFNL